jgi:hypothetical protein
MAVSFRAYTAFLAVVKLRVSEFRYLQDRASVIAPNQDTTREIIPIPGISARFI